MYFGIRLQLLTEEIVSRRANPSFGGTNWCKLSPFPAAFHLDQHGLFAQSFYRFDRLRIRLIIVDVRLEPSQQSSPAGKSDESPCHLTSMTVTSRLGLTDSPGH